MSERETRSKRKAAVARRRSRSIGSPVARQEQDEVLIDWTYGATVSRESGSSPAKKIELAKRLQSIPDLFHEDLSSIEMPNPVEADFMKLKEARSLIKVFDGRSSDQLTEFLLSCEYAFNNVSEYDKGNLLQAVKMTKLEGKALQSVRYKDIQTFEQLKNVLESLYIDRRTVPSLQLEFNSCRQKSGEDVKTYSLRLERILMLLIEATIKETRDISSHRAIEELLRKQALHNFQQGLNDKLRLLIKSQRYESFEAAVSGAIEEERVSGPDSGYLFPRVNRHSDSRHREIKCDRCNKTGHLARNCYTRLPIPQSRGHYSPVPKREVYSINSICNYCNIRGHLWRECRKRLREEADRNHRTYNMQDNQDNYRQRVRQPYDRQWQGQVSSNEQRQVRHGGFANSQNQIPRTNIVAQIDSSINNSGNDEAAQLSSNAVASRK